jgi:hypothetical protein
MGDLVKRMEELRQANVRAVKDRLRERGVNTDGLAENEERFKQGQWDARTQLMVLLYGIEKGYERSRRDR